MKPSRNGSPDSQNNATFRATRGVVIALALSFFAIPLQAVSYYYDDAGRLTQAAFDDGKGIAYAYDDNDNMLSQTSISIPSRPQNLVASLEPDVGITLEWDASQGANEYLIYRRASVASAWTQIATVPTGTLAFLDTTAAEGPKYSYRVVASGSEGLSAYSTGTALLGVFTDKVSFQLVSGDPASSHFKITFTSLEGDNYLLETSSTLNASDWTSASYSLQPAASTTDAPIAGEAEETVIYVEIAIEDPPLFYRIVKQP